MSAYVAEQYWALGYTAGDAGGVALQRQQCSYGNNLFTYSNEMVTGATYNACTSRQEYQSTITPEGGYWHTVIQDASDTYPFTSKPFTTRAAGTYTITLWMLAGSNTTSGVGVFNSISTVQQTVLSYEVLSGPAQLAQVSHVLFVSALSNSTWSKIRITVSGLLATTIYRLLVYAHTPGGTAGTGHIKVAELSAVEGAVAEDYVQTGGTTALFAPSLTTRVLLSASITQVQAMSGDTPYRPLLAASIAQDPLASASLTTRVMLGANAYQTPSVGGALTAQVLFAASIGQVQISSAEIYLPKSLSATGNQVQTAGNPYLLSPTYFVSTIYQAHMVSADLTIFGRYLYARNYQEHIATGGLIGRTILSADVVQVQVSVLATLVVPLGLAALVGQEYVATAILTLPKDLESHSATQEQTVTSELTTRGILVAQGSIQVHTATADLDAKVLMATLLQAFSAFEADLTTRALLSASLIQPQTFLGDVTTRALLSASLGQEQGASASSLVVLKGMYANAVQTHTPTALLVVGEELNATIVSEAISTGSLDARVTLQANVTSAQAVLAAQMRGSPILTATVSCRMTVYLFSASGTLPSRVISDKIARDVQQPERSGVL